MKLIKNTQKEVGSLKTVGVLDLQGAVIEHIDMLNQISGITGIRVKTIAEIESVDALIIPGGESTAISKMMRFFKLDSVIKNMAEKGIPIWGTCAGLILLAKEVEDEQPHLGLIDISAKRNAYGSQLDSFVSKRIIPAISKEEVELVYVRAPYILGVGDGVRVLCKEGDKVVAAREKNILVTAFHPELGKSLTFHQYFVEMMQSS